jgi:hypothetical protein
VVLNFASWQEGRGIRSELWNVRGIWLIQSKTTEYRGRFIVWLCGHKIQCSSSEQKKNKVNFRCALLYKMELHLSIRMNHQRRTISFPTSVQRHSPFISIGCRRRQSAAAAMPREESKIYMRQDRLRLTRAFLIMSNIFRSYDLI